MFFVPVLSALDSALSTLFANVIIVPSHKLKSIMKGDTAALSPLLLLLPLLSLASEAFSIG
jgi:hypothetical protein